MARYRAFSARRKKNFLQELSKTASVNQAARSVGLTRLQVTQLYEVDEEFALAWHLAIEAANDCLEREARRRALEGTEESVFYHGKECARVRRYSDSLLLALLKAERPDKFKDRVASEVSGQIKGGVLTVPQTLDPVSWAELALEYQQRLAKSGDR